MKFTGTTGKYFNFPPKVFDTLEYLSKFGKHLLPLRQHSEPDRREQRQQQRQYVVVKVAATQDEENEIFNYLSVEGRAEVLKNFKGLGIQQLSP